MTSNGKLAPTEVVLYTDGASRGNPGPAGAGVLIADARGEVLVERSEYLGETTNNVAEYKALLIGLAEIEKLAPARVVVRMDSELIVRQLNGVYKVRNAGLLPLFREAAGRIKKLGNIQVVHVPRDQNAGADRLANMAIDLKGNR
ncbi:MAG TPA: ribonuclease HI family protein [Myxococcota bacterium]|nr:ribonuclease HI family protein [Myxococcota bacterium]